MDMETKNVKATSIQRIIGVEIPTKADIKLIIKTKITRGTDPIMTEITTKGDIKLIIKTKIKPDEEIIPQKCHPMIDNQLPLIN